MESAWSKSSLKSLLEGCAWQWALQKVGGLESPPSPQSAAGTGVHAAIERREAARISGEELPAPDQMIDWAMDAASVEAERIDWSRYAHDRDAMFTMMTTALEGWSLDIAPTLDTYTPVLVEPYFRAEAAGAGEVHGYIDWLGRDGDGIWTIVDVKTASSFSRWPQTMDGPSIEAAVYLAGAVHSDILPPDETVRMEWHVAKTKGQPSGRIVRGPVFDPDLIFFLAERIATAEQMVAEKRFPKNPSWNLCSERWCPFYHGCEVSGVLAPEAVSL